MLFIITHQACMRSFDRPCPRDLPFQAYELWFKLILHEIDSVQAMLKLPTVRQLLLLLLLLLACPRSAQAPSPLSCQACAQIEEHTVQKMVHRLQRVKQIWHVLVDQFLVMEVPTR